MASGNMSCLDVQSSPVESPLPSGSPWVTVVVIVAVVTVIIHFELFRCVLDFVQEMVWIPWRVTRRMRKQGFQGPSLSIFHNQTKEMQQLASTIPWDPRLQMTSSGLNHDVEPRVFPHFHTWRKLYGDNFIFKRGPRVHLHTADPEVIKDIFSTNFPDYQKLTPGSLIRDIFGLHGLLFAEGEEWARQRQVVRPPFYPGRTKKLVGQMASWIEIWLQRLDNLVIENEGSLELNMMPKLFDLTSDILARSSFGSSFEKGEEGFRHQEKHRNLVLQRGQIWNRFYLWIPTALNMEIIKENGEMLRCLRETIQDRRNSIQPGNYESYGDDFLGLILAERDRRLALEGRPPGYGEIRDEQITDQCRTFFFAGGDTIKNFLGWATVLLGVYTDWQERIRAEVQETFQSVLPDGDKIAKLKQEVTHEVTHNLKHREPESTHLIDEVKRPLQLTMFVEETLRLYGPVGYTTREVVKDNATLKGKPVPKHLAVAINFCALHRDKEYWGDDAMEFKPERFSQGIAKASKKPNAFMPFGWGPRTCVAKQFALTEVKLILSMLVQRFSILLSPSYRHEPIHAINVIQKFGASIILEHSRPTFEHLT